MGVDVDAARHGGTYNLLRCRLADAGRVVVDKRPLEQSDLLVGQNDFRELSDPRIGAVHDLVGGELVLEHGAAFTDALERVRVELDGLAAAAICTRRSIVSELPSRTTVMVSSFPSCHRLAPARGKQTEPLRR